MRYGTFYVLAVMAVISTVCFGAGSGEPAVANKPGVGLTIYNDNFAVVREARNMKFDKGQNTMRFTDVASAIDPTSVKFSCFSCWSGIGSGAMNTTLLIQTVGQRHMTRSQRGG
jgi:hypothetical protein